jgi:hypothetical protein
VLSTKPQARKLGSTDQEKKLNTQPWIRAAATYANSYIYPTTILKLVIMFKISRTYSYHNHFFT